MMMSGLTNERRVARVSGVPSLHLAATALLQVKPPVFLGHVYTNEIKES